MENVFACNNYLGLTHQTHNDKYSSNVFNKFSTVSVFPRNLTRSTSKLFKVDFNMKVRSQPIITRVLYFTFQNLELITIKTDNDWYQESNTLYTCVDVLFEKKQKHFPPGQLISLNSSLQA